MRYGPLLAVLLIAGSVRAETPAVLVISPQGAAGGWVDLTYLGELNRAGFAVDYTESMADVTWGRLQQYNVLVIYTCPPAQGENAWPFRGAQPIHRQEFIALINRFLAQGGGVLVMAIETQVGVTLVRDLIRPWGADLPLETISDPTNTVFMRHMPTVPLAYTNQVAASPVSNGVRAIWYPVQPHYNGADTIPLAVDAQWQVVVRAMPSARTVPVDLTKASRPGPPDPVVHPAGVTAPPLFAIREVGGGRVALMSQWPVYSIGAGTKWLYDRQVLSAGVDGRRSDFGQLLENSLRWLAQPSLRSKALGGYSAAAERLLAPNLRAQVKRQYSEPKWRGTDPHLLEPPRDSRLFRGLIGAQTALSGGQGTVAEYAAAAKQAGLDFLVFLEDFANLDASKLSQLKADCARHSDAELTLYPGYRIDANIGNHLFLFGPGATIPPTRLLTGPHNATFMLQGESAPGVFGPAPLAAMEFLFSLTSNTQIGYYDFAHSRMGMRLPDARLFAMVGLRSYRNGALLEDLTDAYLTTAQSTIAPAPAAVHLVSSPQALRAAVARDQGLTYAMARSQDQLWADALRYAYQYSCPNVFTSSGPLILRWPACVRVSTLGAEPFVTRRSVTAAPLYVTADKGLKEVRVYDGQNLYRRFILHGEKAFATALYLDDSVQRNLVLVVEDVKGGQAVSFARRSWKDGSLAPVFCGDRYNDCVYMFLARGPFRMTVLRTPELPDAGVTWDGGPRGILTPIDFEGSNPRLESDRGRIDGDQYNQTPLLEFADEGAVAVRSVRDELIDERVRAVNPWNTYGPRAPSPFTDFTLSYVQWDRPSVGVPPVGWAAPPIQAGCDAALFRGAITFKTPLRIDTLRLLHNWNWISGLDLHLAVGRGDSVLQDLTIPEMHVGARTPAVQFSLEHGDWFGFYSPSTANSQFFVNRGEPLVLHMEDRQDGDWLTLWAAPRAQGDAGHVYTYELFAVGCPLDEAAHNARALANALEYLDHPQGLQVSRGTRMSGIGPLELRAERGAVHLSVPRTGIATHLTLPVVVNGFNRRWSAGLWQLSGYVKGDYGGGANRYRALGLDLEGRAYVPLYPDLADHTEVEVGHPVIADARGTDLFIQVTALSGGTNANPAYEWAVDVNNPTDHAITTTLQRNMDLPQLAFTAHEITLAAGEDRVVYGPDPAGARAN